MSRQFLFLLSLGAIAAGCADQRREAPVPTRHADIVLRPDTRTLEARVPRHATLDSLLRDSRLSETLVDATVRAARSVFDLRHLRADRPYRLVLSLDGLLREFEYQIDGDSFLRIVAHNPARPADLEAEVAPYEKEKSIAAVRGRIDGEHTSVIAAIDAAGESVQLAMTLADMFSGQVDFDSDLQPGDGFEVLFERLTRDGQFAGYGAILGARFTAGGQLHQAYRWTDPVSGASAFYDENGRSLKRFFLRSPLRFEPRVTSAFSRSRLHPVFRSYRAHLGVDYGAPAGAPVVAVAAGTIVSAGWSGGGGNMVRIRHAGGFETYYLHLSGFGPGIRSGVHVSQGQLIARVGATGTATGPHLDYRLKKNGVFVNPINEHNRMPPGEPIPDRVIPAFRLARDRVLRELTTLEAEGPRQKPAAVALARD
jgi:murein DD-endopeptidase MepM/ murein hydrolase activator NlpD